MNLKPTTKHLLTKSRAAKVHIRTTKSAGEVAGQRYRIAKAKVRRKANVALRAKGSPARHLRSGFSGDGTSWIPRNKK